ncbi:hypothetical protein [Campylobacter troglodytis]|nr:hypothetical protein [Campylobacter troglodytis]
MNLNVFCEFFEKFKRKCVNFYCVLNGKDCEFSRQTKADKAKYF